MQRCLLLLLLISAGLESREVNKIKEKASYMISAGSKVSFGRPYLISVTLLESGSRRTDPFGGNFMHGILPTTIEASIVVQGSIAITERKECFPGETVLFKFQPSDRQLQTKRALKNIDQNLSVLIEGSHYGGGQGSFFKEEFSISVHKKIPVISLHTRKRAYHPGETVECRCLVQDESGEPWQGLVDIYLYNPNRDETFQWTARNLHSGIAHVAYPLGSITALGEWTMYALVRGEHQGYSSQTKAFSVTEDNTEFHTFDLDLKTRSNTVSVKSPTVEGSAEAKFQRGVLDPVMGRIKFILKIQGKGKYVNLGTRVISASKDYLHLEAIEGDNQVAVVNFYGTLKWSLDLSLSDSSLAKESRLLISANLTSSAKESVEVTKEVNILNSLYIIGIQPASCTLLSGLPADIWIWAEKVSSESLRFEEIDERQVSVWAQVQCRLFQPLAPPKPLQVRGYKRSERRVVWKTSVEREVLDLTKHLIPGDQCHLQIRMKFDSLEGLLSKVINIPLEKEQEGAIELTTSSKTVKVGANVILHARSFRPLQDLQLRVFAHGQLITAETVPLGNALHRLATFHTRVTSEMSPMCTIVVWQEGHNAAALSLVVEQLQSRAKVSGELLMNGDNISIPFTGLTQGAQFLVQGSPIAAGKQVPSWTLLQNSIRLSDQKRPNIRQTFAWPHCQCSDLSICSVSTQAPISDLETADQIWGSVEVTRRDGTAALTVSAPKKGPAQNVKVFYSLVQSGDVIANGHTLVYFPASVSVHLSVPPVSFVGEQVEVKVSLSNGWRHQAQEVALLVLGKGDFTVPNRTKNEKSVQFRMQIPAASVLSLSVPFVANSAGQTLVFEAFEEFSQQREFKRVIIKDRTTCFGIPALCRSNQALAFRGGTSFQVSTMKGCSEQVGKRPSILRIFPAILGPALREEDDQTKNWGDSVVWWTFLDILAQSNKDLRLQLRLVASTFDERFQALVALRHPQGYFTYQSGDETPSLWLTSIALRALHGLSSFHTVDSFMMKKTLAWILSHQNTDGSFQELYWYQGLRDDQLPIEFQQDALSANILLLLAEMHKEGSHWNLQQALDLASSFLITRLHALDQLHRNGQYSDPGTVYTLAAMARALQAADSHGQEAAFEVLAKQRMEGPSGSSWGTSQGLEGTALTVRATALALLVYSNRGELRTDKILLWISRNPLAANDLQTRVLTLEAAAAWSNKFTDNSYVDLRVKSSKSLLGSIKINGLDRKEMQLKPLNGTALEVEGQGSGIWGLEWELDSAENLQPFESDLPSPLGIDASAIHHNTRLGILDIEICARWSCPQNKSVSGPIVINVELPTGFIPLQNGGGEIRGRVSSGQYQFLIPRIKHSKSCYQVSLRNWSCVGKRKSWMLIKATNLLAPDLSSLFRLNLPIPFVSHSCSLLRNTIPGLSSNCPALGPLSWAGWLTAAVILVHSCTSGI